MGKTILKKICLGLGSLVMMALLCLLFTSPGATIGAPPPTPSPSPTPEPTAPPSPTPIPSPTPSPSPTPEPTPEPMPEYFDISFVGDCTLGSNHEARGASGTYEYVVGDNYAYPFENTVGYINDDYLTIANLECCLTSSIWPDVKLFRFKGEPEYVNILKEGSVEMVGLGNNHYYDYAELGAADTETILTEAGVAFAKYDGTGIFETEGGLKVGMFSAEFPTAYQVKAGITQLVNEGCDFIIFAMHAGIEGSYQVTADQRMLAHTAIDYGADFVYGTHPHVLQPYEEYNGKYIYYSLGNFTFGGNSNPRDKDTAILRITVTRDVDGAVYVSDRREIPCSVSSVAGYNDYRPTPYAETDEGYTRAMQKLHGEWTGPDLVVNYSQATDTPIEDEGPPITPPPSDPPHAAPEASPPEASTPVGDDGSSAQ